MREKILFVDDEPAILHGYQRLLRNEFDTEIAVGARGALVALESSGPYAIVVSDMRMPEMDGVQFLAKVKSMSPDTVRIMLTGNADLETAMSAVNEGNIFRFLTKPCSKEAMGRTLTAGLMQFRLVTAEKDLLEKTLHGSVSVLTEVLSLVNPAAFGRALRLRRYMRHVVNSLAVANSWRFEVAAMMSQLGCVTLDPEVIETVNSGRPLSPEDRARYNAHPGVASDLLRNIPRLEPIAWMIAHQNEFPSVEGDLASRETTDMRLGAELLQVTLQFDELISQGLSRTEATHQVARKHKDLDPRVFQALVEVEVEREERKVHECSLEELAFGMIFEKEVRTAGGMLVVARGQEITPPLLLKLKSFCDKGTVAATFTVAVPGTANAKSRHHAGSA